MAKKELTLTIRAKNMLARGLGKAKARLKSFVKTAARIGKGMALAFAGVATAIAYTMVKAQEFNKQIAKVATLTDMSMRKMTKEVRGLSAEFGMLKEEIASGIYQALSAGIPKENIFEFMRVAAMAASAGVTTIKQAVEATTRTLDAYGKSAGNATDINNMLFKTVKLGNVEYEDLADRIGDVAGIAKAANIPLNDLLAVVATASHVVKPKKLFTGVRAAILALSKDAAGAELIFKKGFGGALDFVANSTGNTLHGLRTVITEVRALPIALSVGGDNAVNFAKNLDGITDSSGSMLEAFKKMDTYKPLDKLQEALKNIVLTAGDVTLQALAPTIERAAVAAAKFAEKIADWYSDDKLLNIKAEIEGITNALIEGGDARSEVMGAFANVLIASFMVAADNAANILKRAAPVIGKLIASTITAIWDAYKPGSGIKNSAEYRKASAELFLADKNAQDTYESEEDFEKQGRIAERWLKINEKVIKARAIELQLDKMINGEGEKTGKALTANELKLKQAINYLKEIASKYAIPDVGSQEGPFTDAEIGITDEQKKFNKTKIITTDLDAFILQLLEQEEKQIKRIAEAERKAANKKLADLDKEIAKKKELALLTVAEFIKRNKSGEAQKDALKADATRAAKIRRDRGRGISKTGRRKAANTEFLEGYDKLQAEKKDLLGLEGDKAGIEKKLTGMDLSNKTLGEMNKELKLLRKDITAIMKGG